ncbi:MAG: glutathione S-transferase [Rhodospirillales bacterium]|nr:glutathione S-transferase [Rhodospirillales bacterium]
MADQVSRVLYTTKFSGHGHRVEQFMNLLGLAHRIVDTPAEMRRTPEFAAISPLRQIPVLKDGDLTLADSNAILVYLAKKYDLSGTWLPETPVGAAQVQRFLSLAAGEVAYGPATARRALQWNLPGDPVQAAAIAQPLLQFLDRHLSANDFLAAAHPTIADLACYPYVAHAPEGAISLQPFPSVRAWIARVESIPGFCCMEPLPVPELA